MRFLPDEDQAIVDQAFELGLQVDVPTPAYLSPHLCTALSFLLAVPSLGFSLVLVPILWVAQYDQTKHRILRLQKQLEAQRTQGPWDESCARAWRADDELAAPS